MIRSDADALAAEIAQKYPKRIQTIVAFYRVDEAGIEQFTLRCRLPHSWRAPRDDLSPHSVGLADHGVGCAA